MLKYCYNNMDILWLRDLTTNVALTHCFKSIYQILTSKYKESAYFFVSFFQLLYNKTCLLRTAKFWKKYLILVV